MKSILLLLALLLSILQASSYSESIASRMALLSSAIYNITKADQKSNRCPDCYDDFTPLKQVLGNKVLAMIGVDSKLKSIIVVFRGSSNIRNWITDANILMHSYDEDAKCKKCKVHSGFYKSYQKLATQQVKKAIKKAFKDHPFYTIIFTGHSLGGALANLAAADFTRKLPDIEAKVYTFGQPRVGNSNYAAYMSNKLNHYFRVIHKKDLVPHKPSQLAFYHHSGTEIWYKNGMNKRPRQCKDDSHKCSNSLGELNIDYSLKDHHSAYYTLLHPKTSFDTVQKIVNLDKNVLGEPTNLFQGQKE